MRLRPPAVRFPLIKKYHTGGREAPMPLGGLRAARSLPFSTKVSCRALQKRVWFVGKNGESKRFFGNVSNARKSKGKATYVTFPFSCICKSLGFSPLHLSRSAIFFRPLNYLISPEYSDNYRFSGSDPAVCRENYLTIPRVPDM